MPGPEHGPTYPQRMASTVTIEMPDDVRDALVARAHDIGVSLEELVLAWLLRTTTRSTHNRAVIDRARARKHLHGTSLSAEQVLELRDTDRR